MKLETRFDVAVTVTLVDANDVFAGIESVYKSLGPLVADPAPVTPGGMPFTVQSYPTV